MLRGLLGASCNAAVPDITPVGAGDRRHEDLDATSGRFDTFFFQATGEDKCRGLPPVFRMGVIVRIDPDATNRRRNPQPLHVPRAQRCPNRPPADMAYCQRSLNAFGDGEVLVLFEESDRGASDAAREEPLRFATQ